MEECLESVLRQTYRHYEYIIVNNCSKDRSLDIALAYAVYRVLCYERTHEQTQSSKSAQLNRYAPSYLSDLLGYGPGYLSEEELERKVNEQLQYYYGFLAVSIIEFKGKKF